MAEKKQGSGIGAKAAAATAGAGAGLGTFAALAGFGNKEKVIETINIPEVIQVKGREEINEQLSAVAADLKENGLVRSFVSDGNKVISELHKRLDNAGVSASSNIGNIPLEDIVKTQSGIENIQLALPSAEMRALRESQNVVENVTNTVKENVGSAVKENTEKAANIFQKATGFIGDRFEQFKGADTKVQIGIVVGTALAAVGTYILAEKLLSPKTETKAGTMEHHGQVQQQARGMQVAPA